MPTCAKLLQPAPMQRSIRYWLMVPPVSVAAVQERLTVSGPAAVALRFVGAVGETGATALKATICITQLEAAEFVAEALYEPVTFTMRSSTRLPRNLDSAAKPDPGLSVPVSEAEKP